MNSEVGIPLVKCRKLVEGCEALVLPLGGPLATSAARGGGGGSGGSSPTSPSSPENEQGAGSSSGGSGGGRASRASVHGEDVVGFNAPWLHDKSSAPSDPSRAETPQRKASSRGLSDRLFRGIKAIAITPGRSNPGSPRSARTPKPASPESGSPPSV